MPTLPEALAVAVQHHQAGELSRAEAIYRRILEADPNHADAWHLLGVIAHQEGRNESAIEYIHKAIAIRPRDAAFHNNLGEVYRAQGKNTEAKACYLEALRFMPSNVEALNNLGIVCREEGSLSEATTYLQHAIRLRSNYADALNNLGVVFNDRGLSVEAQACLEQALRIRPKYAGAYNNLGLVFVERGQLSEAKDCFEQALLLRPDYAEAIKSMGSVLREQGKLDEAVARYRAALRLQPGLAGVRSSLLFCLCHDPDIPSERLYAEHCIWGELHGMPASMALTYDNERSTERRLRIGYVSADLYRHAVTLFFEPILTYHDPRQVEVFCYSDVRAPDATTDRLQSLVHGWRSICGLSDRQVVNLVSADRIDILTDLSGHTASNRLQVFAHKPAPIQVTYLGYPCTTGLKTIDYRLTDAVADPPGEPIRDTEELVRLPHGFCVSPLEDAPGVTESPAWQTGRITFVSVHRISKLNVQVIDLWSRLLRMLPRSRLVVSRRSLAGRTKEELQRLFSERGINEDQLELCRPADTRDFLGIFRQADIFLDTFPYGGCTTCCESFWMGVPVLTLRGDRSLGRVGASFLTHLGLTEWIAETPADYVRLAVEHAQDLDRLAELRGGLRDRMRATLCDGATFTRHLEEAFRAMWRKWCNGSVS